MRLRYVGTSVRSIFLQVLRKMLFASASPNYLPLSNYTIAKTLIIYILIFLLCIIMITR